MKPDIIVVVAWIKEAWDSILTEMVIKSFLKFGISNAIMDPKITIFTKKSTIWLLGVKMKMIVGRKLKITLLTPILKI